MGLKELKEKYGIKDESASKRSALQRLKDKHAPDALGRLRNKYLNSSKEDEKEKATPESSPKESSSDATIDNINTAMASGENSGMNFALKINSSVAKSNDYRDENGNLIARDLNGNVVGTYDNKGGVKISDLQEVEEALNIEKTTDYADDVDIFESKMPTRELPNTYTGDFYDPLLKNVGKRYDNSGRQNDVVDSYEDSFENVRDKVSQNVTNPTSVLQPPTPESPTFDKRVYEAEKNNILSGKSDSTSNTSAEVSSFEDETIVPKQVEKEQTEAEKKREEYYANGLKTYDELDIKDRKLLYDYFWIKQIADNTSEISNGIIYERGDGKKIKISASEYEELENEYKTLINTLDSKYDADDIERMQNTLSAYANEYNRAQSDVLSAKFATLHPVMSSIIGTVSPAVFGVLAEADLIAQNVSNIGKEEGYVKPSDNNTPASELIARGTTMRGTVSENIRDSAGVLGETASFLYDATTAIAQSAFAGSLGKVASTLSIFSSAAYDSSKAATERGAEDWQALGTGAVTGALEVLIERMPKFGTLSRLEDLQKIPMATYGDVVRSTFASAHLEGCEEAVTEILGKINEMIWSPSTSTAALTLKEYEKQGLSFEEALFSTVGDISLDVLKAYGGGFIGGAEMQSIGGTMNYAANRDFVSSWSDYFKNDDGGLNTESYNALMTEALSSKDKNVLQYAKQLSNLKDGVTPEHAGVLYSMLVDADHKSIETNSDSEIKEYIAKIQSGETNSDSVNENATQSAAVQENHIAESPKAVQASENAADMQNATEGKKTAIESEPVFTDELDEIASVEMPTVSVGEVYKDSKTGNTIRVLSRDGNNTTYEQDTGDSVTTKTLPNKDMDKIAVNGRYEKVEAHAQEDANATVAPVNNAEQVINTSVTRVSDTNEQIPTVTEMDFEKVVADYVETNIDDIEYALNNLDKVKNIFAGSRSGYVRVLSDGTYESGTYGEGSGGFVPNENLIRTKSLEEAISAQYKYMLENSHKDISGTLQKHLNNYNERHGVAGNAVNATNTNADINEVGTENTVANNGGVEYNEDAIQTENSEVNANGIDESSTASQDDKRRSEVQVEGTRSGISEERVTGDDMLFEKNGHLGDCIVNERFANTSRNPLVF